MKHIESFIYTYVSLHVWGFQNLFENHEVRELFVKKWL